MACLITGIYDVNRNTVLADNNFETIEKWVLSLQKNNVNGIIFHNNFDADTINRHQSELIQFVKIDYNKNFNPNVFRYFVYLDYLKKHIDQINSVFLTDVSDVEMIKNPFLDPLFANENNLIFSGDEPQILNNPWMNDHSNWLRSKIIDYQLFETEFANATLLNCGIIGSKLNLMISLLEKLTAIHFEYNQNNTTAFTSDMGAYNYLLRTKFQNQLFHGTPCNTIFKEYQTERKDCWFMHK